MDPIGEETHLRLEGEDLKVEPKKSEDTEIDGQTQKNQMQIRGMGDHPSLLFLQKNRGSLKVGREIQRKRLDDIEIENDLGKREGTKWT